MGAEHAEASLKARTTPANGGGVIMMAVRGPPAAFTFSLLLVAACGGSGTSSAPAPKLAFSPTSGAVGTIVTITGADFSTASSVSIGGTAAIPLSQSASSLAALVMPGASSGAVNVTTAAGMLSGAATFTVTATGVPATQQGAKLVGTDAVGSAQIEQGYSVAVSADGKTAIVGGWGDNSGAGAAWVFTRDGRVWTQQGAKLVGTGAVGGQSEQAGSVAVSADGNTAIVGGSVDNSGTGAAWVFTRSGSVWTQQGAKLVGTGAVGPAQQGYSVALSADGDTAFVGGLRDNSFVGAAWVFTRSGGVWVQQGAKLVGTDAVGTPAQGASVAVSADGNTAIFGGPSDNTNAGAAWVFARNGGVWTQQGAKLVGTGAVGPAVQGRSVAVSADGSTAIVGGWGDNSNAGAAWVFTRNGGVWMQQGAKLVGTGATGSAVQGQSVAVSADGSTAIVGGSLDNSFVGAAWVFTRTSGVWMQRGAKLVGSGAATPAEEGTSAALSADGNTAVVGGPADNSSAGAAWVYTP
jgi:hypothetical protein